MLKRKTPAPTITVGTGVYDPTAGKPARGKGVDTAITVKGTKATEAQKTTINECLGEAEALGASKRVMIAVVMCITQESDAGDPKEVSKGSASGSRGPFQQEGPWGPLSDRMDDRHSTRMFLTGGQGGQAGWKQIYGSVKNAPGDLGAGVQAVQKSAFPTAYSQWENEAKHTVESWLGGYVTGKRFVAEPYEFTRGEKNGEEEDSWACAGRLAQEVEWRRWAQENTLFVASDEELRAAAPSLEITGDEPWLLGDPQWEWNPKATINTVTLKVLADSWNVQIGAVVLMRTPGPNAGRFLVTELHGGFISPILEVVLSRPVAALPEPAHTVREVSGTTESTLLAECETISQQDHPYVYGGGHGPKLSAIGPHDGLDCSSSCSLALYRAKMFNGDVAIVSSEFASSWGSPGKGRTFTVWANSEHVWIEFAGSDHNKRFDTSPHGTGPSGPHVRDKPRTDQERFTPRHWPGQ